MARALISILTACLLLGGCQSLNGRAITAAETQGAAQALSSFPDLPEACVAKVERVLPKVGEKARWTQKRWEFVADNRDRLTEDCAAWGADIKARTSVAIPSPRPNQ